jgi:hypothetical protein
MLVKIKIINKVTNEWSVKFINYIIIAKNRS